jgi:hypothetical protein
MKKIIPWNLNDLKSVNPKVKYGCAKKLVAAAKEDPSALFPQIDFFVELLDSSNQILKWTAIDIVGYMIKADKEKKVDRLLGRLCGFLNDGKLITAGHAATALAGIARVKPEYGDRIAKELMQVERYKYDTAECRNIALGIGIQALGSFYDGLDIKGKHAVREFVKRQVNSRRPATGKKAEQFLKNTKTKQFFNK